MEFLYTKHLTKKRRMQLAINNPCHQNWANMLPAQQGKFCQACSKTVIDFTAMPLTQIQNYFATQGTTQDTCGRFGATQLQALNLSTAVLHTPIALWKKYLALIIICFGMFLTSCNTANNSSNAFDVPTNKNTTALTSLPTQKDTSVTPVIIKKDTVCKPKLVTPKKLVAPNDDAHIVGKLKAYPPPPPPPPPPPTHIIMGDIAYIPDTAQLKKQ
jgi:hypothetical protein